MFDKYRLSGIPDHFARFVTLTLLAAVMMLGAGAASTVRAAPEGFADLADRLSPAVVNISTVTQIEVEQHPLLRDPFFRRFFSYRFGCCFLRLFLRQYP